MRDEDEDGDRPRRPKKRRDDPEEEGDDKPWRRRRDPDAEGRPRRRRDPDEDDEHEHRPRRRRRSVPDDEDDEDDDQGEGLEYLLPVNTSGLAIAAGYLGLFSVLCVPAPIALILGIMALVQLKKKPKLHGRYRAVFAVVMGGLFTVFTLAFIVLAIIQKK